MRDRLLFQFFANPFLSIVTGLTASLATLYGFIYTLALPFFWSDVAISLAVTYLAIHWTIQLTRQFFKHNDIGLGKRQKKSLVGRFSALGVSVLVPPVLIVLLVSNARFPISHLMHPRWILCGTFVSSCGAKQCLKLLDAKGRATVDSCIYSDDDTGYKYLAPPHWWTYKPEKIVTQCQGDRLEPSPIDKSMYDSSCEGILKLK